MDALLNRRYLRFDDGVCRRFGLSRAVGVHLKRLLLVGWFRVWILARVSLFFSARWGKRVPGGERF